MFQSGKIYTNSDQKETPIEVSKVVEESFKQDEITDELIDVQFMI